MSLGVRGEASPSWVSLDQSEVVHHTLVDGFACIACRLLGEVDPVPLPAPVFGAEVLVSREGYDYGDNQEEGLGGG